MKTTLLIFLLSISAYAQDYAYFKTGFDLNNAIGIIDNPRTQIEILGYDADFEIGARDRHVGVYITHGRFEAQDYQNYAAGVDYYVNWIKGLDMSLGANYGVVLRRYDGFYNPLYESKPDPQWKGGTAIAFRGVMSTKIYKFIYGSATLQYQQRPELGKFVLEGSVGIELRLNL